MHNINALKPTVQDAPHVFHVAPWRKLQAPLVWGLCGLTKRMTNNTETKLTGWSHQLTYSMFCIISSHYKYTHIHLNNSFCILKWQSSVTLTYSLTVFVSCCVLGWGCLGLHQMASKTIRLENESQKCDWIQLAWHQNLISILWIGCYAWGTTWDVCCSVLLQNSVHVPLPKKCLSAPSAC